MSSPFSDDCVVVNKEILFVIEVLLLSVKIPEKVKFAAPFASLPLVIM